ncbi:GNAT family N-acetyltransferase [Buttiauxella selenatireducens]|uniref:GNAT family N-acetyltransferase n=1 Tax=Buttiauxella selenatireducens TaxID=3073902 RepID=A0ABY9SIC6_9ENTR|nr:GNAT family N-acetyltransferase [Buttiauxella sp. R73]WMY76605.1 GNAT family N-acetyltransferase [Buttiauxella sp. R73]
MTGITNEFQQPIGNALPGWQPCPRPERIVLQGKYCHLEPLTRNHADSLWAAWSTAEDDRGWTYLNVGPFDGQPQFADFIDTIARSHDPLHYAVIDELTGKAVGTLALMRIDPANGVVEVGFVMYSPRLQRTVQATEAHFLLMKYAFGLGYRRYEWKCDSLNAPSRHAAIRLGFRYEGLFRQAVVYKQRTRDTAWFSILDSEWPTIEQAFERWLSVENMPDGAQKLGLSQIRENLVSGRAPATRQTVQVRALDASDYAAWRVLWQGYLSFYNTQLSDELSQLTWQRMCDPAEPMFALGAFDEQGKMLGFTHMVYHRGTWSADDHCYLEDLFTAPESRGKGVGCALIEAVYQHAQAKGSQRVYWHTHETNAAGQALYDKLADKSGFIQYQKDVK